VIELNKVTFAYEKQPVLRDISLKISSGEMLGIIGPNSSGKSTLLRLMAGILRPAAGNVLIDGRDISRLSRREAARLVSFVPQETPASFPFSVFEIVLMGRTPHVPALSFERETDFQIAREALDSTDTLSLRERFLDELSGGERQLVIIARSLAQEAQIMLFDEPTTFLDMRHQVQIFEIITRLNRNQGRTVVMVSHDLNLASIYCDRLVLLSDGKVAADGTPGEVLSSPVLQETFRVKMTVSTGPAGRPFVVPESTAQRKGD
jgi:iron complex transport system ATP-binding protein